ncbi:3-demethylubiquinone-9 3-methyltransferase [Grosmannia clavigera kw1407]|uniref:Ubiquinone biosynthesis O-methyltransferase, mitochondrial n=1 Tax=Grosmannia clavigera (strain kw1407 / UAMH 11150) TaxID=655863 RepID=F0XGB6_GROCL|nr:3-demethylubiquinone-9 3-methyltransferase [Grosmannia clavigera kw1407]EFX02584.1 3-demethylubiquinone-9 3-methyltransferase [Grosmannia clavigera kw1407]
MLTLRAAVPVLRRAQRCVRAGVITTAAACVESSRTAKLDSRRSHSSSSTTASSVSPEEVAHFNGLAAAWWDPHGSSRLLHQMNPLRHDFIRHCLGQEEPLPGRILDVGCGGGIFAESAARLTSTTAVTAIDPSAEVLAVARTHARRDPVLQHKLHYVQASIENMTAGSHGSPDAASPSSASLSSTTGPFDMVTTFEVVEHVATDPGAFLAQCGRLLRPGGWLIGSTMARTWISWLTTIVAAEDVLGIVPHGTHDWAKYVNPDELAAHFAPGTGAACSQGTTWETLTFQGVAYIPGLGWQVVPGSEELGNYFFGIRKGRSESTST